MLHADDLPREPGGEEVAVDAAVPAKLAVIVGRSLPDAERGQMRRPQRAGRPLVHGVIRYTVHADLAVAPRLGAGPFDALINVLRLARRPDVEHAGRAAGAAGIDADDGV